MHYNAWKLCTSQGNNHNQPLPVHLDIFSIVTPPLLILKIPNTISTIISIFTSVRFKLLFSISLTDSMRVVFRFLFRSLNLNNPLLFYIFIFLSFIVIGEHIDDLEYIFNWFGW